MKCRISTAILSLALAGCVQSTAVEQPEYREVGQSGECDADLAKSFVGQRATTDSGAAILRATGASTLRWGPPDSVFTMDYRPDRVNVMYDAEMAITEVR